MTATRKEWKGKTKIRAIALIFVMLLAVSLLPAQEAEAASTENYLFIGNSLTYYNNMPEIFQNIASAAGRRVNCTAITYVGRTLSVHASAIKAVIRTKGKASKLTKAEKSYFCSKCTGTYSVDVYNNYAAALWDYSKNKPKHYDKIVLQPTYRGTLGDVPASTATAALKKIITAINDSKTTYVVNIPAGQYPGKPSQFVTNQSYADQQIGSAVTVIKNTASLKKKYANIITAYVGRAFYNFMYYAGTTKIACKREPEAFAPMNYYKGYVNDLFYGDYTHYTPLGSYLEAATIYQSIYGGVRSTCNYYKGGSKTALYAVDGKGGSQFSALYNNGNGFVDGIIVKYAAFIAEATMRYGMNLNSKAAAKSWWYYSSVQYPYMNYCVTLVFDGTDAEKNTYKKQLYWYKETELAYPQYFQGEISRMGYDLLGWRLGTDPETKVRYKPNNKVTSSFVKRQYTKGKYTVTLYAVWQPHEVKLSFDANGADVCTYEEQILTYDNPAQLKGEISREGYEFLGWSLNADASTLEIEAGKTIKSSVIDWLYGVYGKELTLYAVWVPVEGTEPVEESVTEEPTIEEPDTEEPKESEPAEGVSGDAAESSGEEGTATAEQPEGEAAAQQEQYGTGAPEAGAYTPEAPEVPEVIEAAQPVEEYYEPTTTAQDYQYTAPEAPAAPEPVYVPETPAAIIETPAVPVVQETQDITPTAAVEPETEVFIAEELPEVIG